MSPSARAGSAGSPNRFSRWACRMFTRRRCRVTVATGSLLNKKTNPSSARTRGSRDFWLSARDRYAQLQLDRHEVRPIIMIALTIPLPSIAVTLPRSFGGGQAFAVTNRRPMSAPATTTAIDRRIRELLREYGAPDLCLAEVLCDPAPAGCGRVLRRRRESGRPRSHLRRTRAAVAPVLRARSQHAASRPVTASQRSCPSLPTSPWRCSQSGAAGRRTFRCSRHSQRPPSRCASTRAAFASSSSMRGNARNSARPDRAVIVTGGAGRAGDIAFEAAIAENEPQETPARLGGNGPFVRLFTSGTTGDPKAVVIPAHALAAFVAYQEIGLDVQVGDVFWNAADPGWAYGLYYAICAPLATGRRSLLLAAPFSADLTFRVLATFGVTNFAAAPHRLSRATQRRRRTRCFEAPRLFERGRAVERRPRRMGKKRARRSDQRSVRPNGAWHGRSQRARFGGRRAAATRGSMGHAMPGFSVAILAASSADVVAPGEPGRVAVDLSREPAHVVRNLRGCAGADRGALHRETDGISREMRAGWTQTVTSSFHRATTM